MSQLAALLKANQSNLVKTLQGNPRLDTLKEVAFALDVEPSDLLSDANPATPIGAVEISGVRYGVVSVPNGKPIPLYTSRKTLEETITKFISNDKNENTSIFGRIDYFDVFCIVKLPTTLVLSVSSGEEFETHFFTNEETQHIEIPTIAEWIVDAISSENPKWKNK